MSDGQGNPLAAVVESLPTIPAATKPGLVRGLSYLLGGLGNYLGAWLRRPVQAVEDRTDARTIITRAIALAAAEKLSSDTDVVAAAVARWGPADVNRQLNKMRIAKETLREFSEGGENDATGDLPPPSDDFLNSYERFCADSSDENMQKLWARLLAGEIRRPGSFSRHTMRCLYELDTEIATLFQRIAMRTVGGVLLYETSEEIRTYEINKLQAAGLITGGGGIYNWTLKFDEKGFAMIKGEEYVLIAKKADGGSDFSITSYPLTQAGEELIKLLPDYSERGALVKMLDQISSEVASEIAISSFTTNKSGEIVLSSTETLRET